MGRASGTFRPSEPEPGICETAGSTAVPGRPGRTAGRWRSALAWTAVGCWTAWALGRLAGADRLPGVQMPITPLISFTPYAAATAVVPVLGAALLRHRRALIAGALTAGVLAALVLPRAVAASQPPAHGPRLRVLTANLRFGLADPDRIVELVRHHAVDVLSLQELTPKAVERLNAAGLGRLLPHAVLHPRSGAAGSGLYARHPLRELPALPGSVFAMPRAELTLPAGRKVEVAAVHPPPPISGRAVGNWMRDLRALPAAGRRGQPVRILAGDYNATLDHAHFRRVLSRGYADAADRAGMGLTPTWSSPGGRIRLTIDHVLVDRRCAVHRVRVHDLPGSDHRAVFADVRLP